jgi:hypothetical protein
MAHRICFDLLATQPIGSSKFHGGGEYAKAVLQQLVLVETNDQVECIYDSSKWFDPKIANLCQKNNLPLVRCPTDGVL